MLQRYREYLRDTPVQAWLTNVSCLFSVFAALNVAFPSRNNFGMANLNFGDILGWPTFLLLYRFSDQQQQKNPISAFQQKAVGILSLLALGSSVAAKRAPTLYTYLGLTIPPSVEMTMLVWFSVSALLAVALGYAARRSKVGRMGLVLSAAWLVVILLTGILYLTTAQCR